MTFWFKGHHYRTQFRHTLAHFVHWWSIKGFLKAVWHGEKYLIWFSHQDDCCDYWTPIDSLEAKRALILDDELGLTAPDAQLEGSDGK